MAFPSSSQRRAARRDRGLSLGVALCALLACGAVAGTAWGLASSLSALHQASRTLAEGPARLALATVDRRSLAPVARPGKASRVQTPPDSELRAGELTAEAIRGSHSRSLAEARALAENRAEQGRRTEAARLLAAVAPTQPTAPAAQRTAALPAAPSLAGSRAAMVTALVEDVPLATMQPFDLVLSEDDAEETLALPGDVPLPEARPARETAALPPPEDLPRSRALPQAAAPEKPGRSLFGDLFRRKEGALPQRGSKVAIYDVSAATVYMPDGSRLRAHSGIGAMRDNPRYDHVTMRGPTPSGIYRLSMREKRFYGVEAIRMTSIDGRDPKNRTGLLTHTNLLRGQIGSHGCVAFQNYEPFLRAFKRGEVKMLVVVPEMPSSPAKLAALYRKAGA